MASFRVMSLYLLLYGNSVLACNWISLQYIYAIHASISEVTAHLPTPSLVRNSLCAVQPTVLSFSEKQAWHRQCFTANLVKILFRFFVIKQTIIITDYILRGFLHGILEVMHSGFHTPRGRCRTIFVKCEDIIQIRDSCSEYIVYRKINRWTDTTTTEPSDPDHSATEIIHIFLKFVPFPDFLIKRFIKFEDSP